MSEEILKNCPFCDSIAAIWEVKSLANTPLYQVLCHGKSCVSLKSFKTKQEAIEKWNRRA